MWEKIIVAAVIAAAAVAVAWSLYRSARGKSGCSTCDTTCPSGKDCGAQQPGHADQTQR